MGVKKKKKKRPHKYSQNHSKIGMGGIGKFNNSRFIPGHKGARGVTRAIRSFDFHPGAGMWPMVPKSFIQLYWNEFQKECVWHPKYDKEIYDLFLKKAQNRYKQMMNKFHNAYKLGLRRDLRTLPGGRTVWDTLVEYWNSDAFKKRSERAAKNRKSDPYKTGIAKHRGGSRSLLEQKMQFKKTHDIEPDYLDGLKILHPVDPSTRLSPYFRTTEIHNKLKEAIAAASQPQQMSEDDSCGASDRRFSDLSHRFCEKHISHRFSLK